ncbi:hypothetical protein Nepgr_000072 [Nepenthes gracilis]|uniref:SOSEKI DIX-like domain-containing protein n=1 Tax=Nepenthes gracilis TaxID=150966 RepID=A0AAD3RWH6_NEPGR|nr:hypothetical protein Nepgr_000072 [Nepenthes gracilis]
MERLASLIYYLHRKIVTPSLCLLLKIPSSPKSFETFLVLSFMAVTLRGRSELQLLQVPKKWKERETSPERTKVWTEPLPKNERRVVPVVYYISRNGQLEHPHFMEVPLSSSEGLFLRDVINRLSLLRGKGMASQYCWSSKRSYKNGYVWHDLDENDFIHPVHGQEYVLKGSEILENSAICKYLETASSSSSKNPPEIIKADDESDLQVRNRRRNQSWSSIDLHEYKVYKAESTDDFGPKIAADASTQTDDKRRRRRAVVTEEEEPKPEEREKVLEQGTELSREEISPPPSDSSPETLESLMKADGRLILSTQTVNQTDQDPDRSANHYPSGRIKASSVLMSLISCGSVSFRDCGATAVKDHGFSFISHYKPGLPRGGNQVEKEREENGRSLRRIALEDKEYFSGSLIETKKDEIPSLKRSSSYNADRASNLDIDEKEMGGVRAKCIPRKPKAQLEKKEVKSEINGVAINSSQVGNKRADA